MRSKIHPFKNTTRTIIFLSLLPVLLLVVGILRHWSRFSIEKIEYANHATESIRDAIQNRIARIYDIALIDEKEVSFENLSVLNKEFIVVLFKLFGKDVFTIEKSTDTIADSSINLLINQLINKQKLKNEFFFLKIIEEKKTFHFSACKLFLADEEIKSGIIIIGPLPVNRLLFSLSKVYYKIKISALKMDDVIVSSPSNNPCLIHVINDPSIWKENRNYFFKYRTSERNGKYLSISHIISENIMLKTLFINHSIPRSYVLMISLFSFLIVFLAIIILLANKSILNKKISELNKVVESISQKDFDTKVTADYSGELGILARSINKMSLQLKEVYENLEIKVIRRTSEISMRNAELRKKQREILKQNHELKLAYEALKESREKYEKLIEHLEEEYIFYSQSVKGDLLFVSPSVKKILGYNVKEFRKLNDTLYTNNPINKNARKRSENSRKGIVQPKYQKEIFDIRKQPKILEVSEVPVFNEAGQLVSVEGLAHDITERQKAEELIKEQEEKYRMLFTHASEIILLYEINKKTKKVENIIEANNYAIEKLGFSAKELRKMTLLELNASEIGQDNDDEIEEYLADGKEYERAWNAKEGDIIDVEISSHSFHMKNKHVAIAVARDITERKKAEEEIRFINEELYNQKENLEALVDNLTQTQEQLVQSEKMAALGQLIAGIAHEINTPLGAIKASIGNLSDSLNVALDELPSLFQQQSKDNLKFFTYLFGLTNNKSPELSSREKRQKKRELTKTLKENNINQANILADLLIYVNVFEMNDALGNYLKLPDAVKVIRSVRSFISLLKNTNTINLAVEKATKTVFALKKYAHRDSEGEKVSTDIIDGIETVLTLYHNQLKQGIVIKKNYGKLPLVKCYQDEISQVWTNLIQNAIQAMDQEGTLTISTRDERNMIFVSFRDTGAGIAPDIKDKIFDPFFTTKKQGEGSGLGLDIVKKIIEKHNGNIEVESELGEGATFIIHIPVR
ncbi:Adaptive-response sensory-kinase SasA [subsurface metagenome]